MIQRIQSIFLFLTALVLGLNFIFPIAEFIGTNDSLVLYAFKAESLVPGSENVYDIWFTMPLLAIISIVIIFSIATIFMYKNRLGQIKIIRFLMLLIVVLVAVIFLYYENILSNASGAEADFIQIGAFSPLVAMVLLFLANRGVIKDEKLVRSADRLR